jgi:hypothetical protein
MIKDEIREQDERNERQKKYEHETDTTNQKIKMK